MILSLKLVIPSPPNCSHWMSNQVFVKNIKVFQIFRHRGRFCQEEGCESDRCRVRPRHREQSWSLEDALRTRSSIYDLDALLQYTLVSEKAFMMTMLVKRAKGQGQVRAIWFTSAKNFWKTLTRWLTICLNFGQPCLNFALFSIFTIEWQIRKTKISFN